MNLLLWKLKNKNKSEVFVYMRRITTLAFIAYARIFIRRSVYTHSSLTLHQLILYVVAAPNAIILFYEFFSFRFVSIIWTHGMKMVPEQTAAKYRMKNDSRLCILKRIENSLEDESHLNWATDIESEPSVHCCAQHLHTVRYYSFAIADFQHYLLHFNSNKCCCLFFFQFCKTERTELKEKFTNISLCYECWKKECCT